MEGAMPVVDPCATRRQLAGERIVLQIAAGNVMSLIKQQMCNRTHPGAPNSDDVVARHDCLIFGVRGTEPPRRQERQAGLRCQVSEYSGGRVRRLLVILPLVFPVSSFLGVLAV